MQSRRGSVTILAAALFAVLIAMCGLVVEYGSAVMTKARYQRIADSAAYAGAMAYATAGSESAIDDAVERIASLNGISEDELSANLVSSPNGDGRQAVQATVTSSAPLSLTRLVASATNVTISASAYAELNSTSPACVLALSDDGDGITLSGGTSLSAPNCAVGSNQSVTVPNGTSITTQLLTYNSENAPSQTTLANIQAPSGKTLVVKKQESTDPLHSTSGVAAEVTHLASLEDMTAPTAPAAPSPPANSNVSFDWSSSSMTVGGCQATRNGSTWTVTCTGNGPFYFGSISAGGGITLNFNANGSATADYEIAGNINLSSGSAFSFGPGTYHVSGSIITGSGPVTFGAGNYSIGGNITVGSSTVSFGAGTFNIHGGISTGGGSVVSFGAGTFNLGMLSSSCQGYSGYSICQTGTSMTIAGPSSFSIAGGVYVAGGEVLTLGTTTIGSTSPAGNSFSVGEASDGNSLNMGGGAVTTLADTTSGSGVFQMTGNIRIGGGSCLVMSAAANHDIGGSISAAGGIYLGSGVYSVNGYVALGAGGGGDVSCKVNGAPQSLGLSGTGVTFGIAGNATANGWPCSNTVFCAAAGYSHVSLTAPGSGPTHGLLVIGPITDDNTAGASFTEGASGTTLSGAFYVPNGPITLSGGASVGSGAGQCLELIGSEVTLSGGATLASACTGLGGSGDTTALLVQ